jgi:hypothetical protein
VRQNFDAVAAAARETRAAYEPFMQKLQDLQKALSLDLTPPGVQGSRGVMDQVRDAAGQLNRRIDTLIAEVERVRTGMVPTATR